MSRNDEPINGKRAMQLAWATWPRLEAEMMFDEKRRREQETERVDNPS